MGTNRYSYSANDPINLMDPGGNSVDPAAPSQEDEKEDTEQVVSNDGVEVKKILGEEETEGTETAWMIKVKQVIHCACQGDPFEIWNNMFGGGGGGGRMNGGKAANNNKAVKAKPPTEKDFKGGRFGDLPTRRNMHRHHMPADAATKTRRVDGPAIQMREEHHVKTLSWGPKKIAKQYRQVLQNLLSRNRPRDAMALEIRNVRSIAGSTYNNAIREMLDYAKSIGGYAK